MDTSLLPIGTIIKIYNDAKKYIIMGTFCKIDNKMFTYYCCMYPYGLILDNGEINDERKKCDIYINQEDIENIIFLGNVNGGV